MGFLQDISNTLYKAIEGIFNNLVNISENDQTCKTFAKVVGKRECKRLMRTGRVNRILIYYFATFEFQDGQRIELPIPRENEFSLLLAGDCGILEYQNNFYVSFERKKNG